MCTQKQTQREQFHLAPVGTALLHNIRSLPSGNFQKVFLKLVAIPNGILYFLYTETVIRYICTCCHETVTSKYRIQRNCKPLANMLLNAMKTNQNVIIRAAASSTWDKLITGIKYVLSQIWKQPYMIALLRAHNYLQKIIEKENSQRLQKSLN